MTADSDKPRSFTLCEKKHASAKFEKSVASARLSVTNCLSE